METFKYLVKIEEGKAPGKPYWSAWLVPVFWKEPQHIKIGDADVTIPGQEVPDYSKINKHSTFDKGNEQEMLRWLAKQVKENIYDKVV